MDLFAFVMQHAITFSVKKFRRRFMKYAKRMLALVLVALPILAVAQGASSKGSMRIVSDVPFAAMVANKNVPAGEWTVERAPGTFSTLVIRNVGAKVGLFSTARPNLAKTASESYALVFHKYGDKAFLTGIKLAGDRTVYQIPESGEEAELRAQNVTATEEILLASAK
jgi:hypothetical protein